MGLVRLVYFQRLLLGDCRFPREGDRNVYFRSAGGVCSAGKGNEVHACPAAGRGAVFHFRQAGLRTFGPSVPLFRTASLARTTGLA